ncbi:MAG: 50S ribosomal protein L29 [Verrucomicrobia bacterium]|nr:50S ribosomal protein L29 [Verrucomicrobiota bacterium]
MKASELRDLTVDELQQRYEETQKELFNLRIQQSTGQLENPIRMRDLRRDVARIKTIISERAEV